MTKNRRRPSREEEDFHALFPYKLHTMLSLVEQQGLSHIISWLPCGRAFKVHDSQKFEECVLPKMGRLSRYKSFLRQLNMYKFKRLSSSAEGGSSSKSAGAYHHLYFRRGHPDLCRGVLRGEEMPVSSTSRTTSFVPKKVEEHCESSQRTRSGHDLCLPASIAPEPVWYPSSQNFASARLCGGIGRGQLADVHHHHGRATMNRGGASPHYNSTPPLSTLEWPANNDHHKASNLSPPSAIDMALAVSSSSLPPAAPFMLAEPAPSSMAAPFVADAVTAVSISSSSDVASDHWEDGSSFRSAGTVSTLGSNGIEGTCDILNEIINTFGGPSSGSAPPPMNAYN